MSERTHQMKGRSRLLVAMVALAATGLVAGCGSEEVDRLSVDDGPVEGGGNAMTPAKLTAQEGHEVEIEVTNTAPDKEHGFSIDEFNVSKVIEQGRSTTVKFKADKTGTFRVYCQLHPTHKPAELVVS